MSNLKYENDIQEKIIEILASEAKEILFVWAVDRSTQLTTGKLRVSEFLRNET